MLLGGSDSTTSEVNKLVSQLPPAVSGMITNSNQLLFESFVRINLSHKLYTDIHSAETHLQICSGEIQIALVTPSCVSALTGVDLTGVIGKIPGATIKA